MSHTNDRRTDEIRAKAAGTNRNYLAVAEMLNREHPRLFEQVAQGVVSIPQAKMHIKAEEQAFVREENQRMIDSSPSIDAVKNGLFSTIICDPPWKWESGSSNRAPNYQTMEDEEIFKFPISDKAAANAHLYLSRISQMTPFALACNLRQPFENKGVDTFHANVT